MKKNKLKLEELSMNSFITNVSKAERNTVKGALHHLVESAHILYETAEITVELASVIKSVGEF